MENNDFDDGSKKSSQEEVDIPLLQLWKPM